MWTRRLRPGLILGVAVGIVVLLAFNFALAAIPQPTPHPIRVPVGSGVTTTPSEPMAAIEFVGEAGVERWQVKLTRGGSDENAYLRIAGPSCTDMGEIYRGMITPLYDDMTFKTKSGKTCRVQAIER
jgi:hypothetical protein